NGRCTGHATQPENWNTTNVSTQFHPVDQQRVHRWTANAGHRSKKERAQIPTMQASVRQSACNRFLTQLLGGANPVTVGLAPGFHFQIFFFGKREESSIDTDVTMQTP